MRKMLSALLLLILPALPLSATTIVVVKTRNEIVIGADSKVTDTFGNAAPTQACKIVQAGNAVFAYAGFARDPQNGYSIPEIAAAALKLKPKASFRDKADTLARVVVEKLEIVLPLVKAKSPVTFREKIEGKTFLRIVITGFEKGKPVIFVRLFRFGIRPDQSAGVIVQADDCDSKCRTEYATRFLGETEAIDGVPEETPGFWKPGLVPGVRTLIETQIAAREDYVGPPIDILRITPKKIEWVERKPLCAD